MHRARELAPIQRLYEACSSIAVRSAKTVDVSIARRLVHDNSPGMKDDW